MEHSFSQKEQPPNLEVKGRETATAGGLSELCRPQPLWLQEGQGGQCHGQRQLPSTVR